MKILITGATGLVGKNLIKKLLYKSYKINFLTTQKNKIESIEGCIGFYWNPYKGIIDLNAFYGVTHIINLAGESISKPWTKKYKIKLIQSRVLSSQIIYNSLVDLNHKVDCIISASAIGYYPGSEDLIFKESNIYKPDNFLQKIVNKWENSTNELEIHSKRLVTLRIGLVLSDKGGFLSKLVSPIKFGVGSSFGSGRQSQSWIHIEDLSNLILHSIDNNLNGVFNAVSPNPISQSELVKCLGKRLKRPVFLPNIPAIIVKIILGERSQLLLDSHNISSDKLIDSGFKFNFEKFDKAIADLKLN
jgi:uncharacterized protein (TIGR01777 family)